MERHIQNLIDHNILLDNVAIFCLDHSLPLGNLGEGIFFTYENAYYIVSEKQRQREIAKSIMSTANEKDLQLYVKDLTFSHICIVALHQEKESIVPNYRILPAAESTAFTQRLDIKIFLEILSQI